MNHRDAVKVPHLTITACLVTSLLLSACGGGGGGGGGSGEPASDGSAVGGTLTSTVSASDQASSTAQPNTLTVGQVSVHDITATTTDAPPVTVQVTEPAADAAATPTPTSTAASEPADTGSNGPDATALGGMLTATAATGVSGAAVPAPQVTASVSALSTPTELATANAAAWPFTQPALSTLRASPRKVFAHYVTPFPISIDNLAPTTDYYTTQYLSPLGEGRKFYASGGYIKQRPMPRISSGDTTWYRTDVGQDIRRAAAAGIDGFAVDILASSGEHWDRVKRVMDMAQAIDPGFKVLLVPDMEGEFKSQPGNVVTAVRALATHPSAYRLADGRLVLSPYNAQNQSPAWWATQLATLRKVGVNVAFMPLFQGWGKYAAAYASISTGMSDWGDRSPSTNKPWLGVPAQAHALKQLWMAPVAPQDARAKDLLYWEARNSENYRVMWENAIQGGADWVNIITWNDYSEATEVAPSSGTQWSFYDLTAYYTTWFKTGVKPATTRDVLYYFHRTQATTAVPTPGKQARPYVRGGGSDAAANDIELVAFATAPATVRITIGQQVTTQAVPAGLTAVRVPLAEGTPVFEMIRNNATVTAVRSGYPISNSITWQDLLYRSGASTRALVAPR